MDRGTRFKEDLLAWADDNLRDFPWRRDELTPYEALVAEMLLRRTRAENVDPVYREFIDRYPDLGVLAAASVAEIASVLAPLGLHNIRANALKTTAESHHRSGVPKTKEELRALPQTGRYVANAVLCFGHDKRQPIVDANVARVYSRIFGLDVMEDQLHMDEELWELASELLPESGYETYNLALLDFGAEICTPRSPNCEECFANDYCDHFASTM